MPCSTTDSACSTTASRRSGDPVTGTFSVSDAVELAVVERSGFIESRHAGSAVVLSPEGEVLRDLGDTRTPTFPRSCLKPFQAVAVMTSGVTLRGEDAAGNGGEGTQLPLQGALQLSVLVKRVRRAAGGGVEPHQLPVGLLPEGIQGDGPARVLERLARGRDGGPARVERGHAGDHVEVGRVGLLQHAALQRVAAVALLLVQPGRFARAGRYRAAAVERRKKESDVGPRFVGDQLRQGNAGCSGHRK